MIITRPEIEITEEAEDEASFRIQMEELIRDYPDHWILGEIEVECVCYAFLHKPASICQDPENCMSLYYYNDYDDYEDGIEPGSERWLCDISQGRLSEEEIHLFLQAL